MPVSRNVEQIEGLLLLEAAVPKGILIAALLGATPHPHVALGVRTARLAALCHAVLQAAGHACAATCQPAPGWAREGFDVNHVRQFELKPVELIDTV